jgi:hypothetical protein
MTLNDLLQRHDIDPRNVLVLRHRPKEPELRKVLPWLAAERPRVFNAYQQTRGPKLERAIQSLIGRGFVASFIGHEPGKALFVGLYSIDASKALTYKEYWSVPETASLSQLSRAYRRMNLPPFVEKVGAACITQEHEVVAMRDGREHVANQLIALVGARRLWKHR